MYLFFDYFEFRKRRGSQIFLSLSDYSFKNGTNSLEYNARDIYRFYDL